MKNIEFNMMPDGEIEIRKGSSPAFILQPSDYSFITPMLELIRGRYPKAYQALCERYEKSIENKSYFNFLIVRGFIKCNMSCYDNRLDIDDEGNMHFEFVSCPLIGECKYYQVICQPEESTEISEAELRVLKRIAAGQLTNKIADQLCISPKTVENHTNNMLRKTKLHNNAALTNYFHTHFMALK